MNDQDYLRFRQIHLDFHTSPCIDDVGVRFDAEQFASTLENARVDSITCFAKCHHGMFYYRSKKFESRIHPGLHGRDLLREQIEACHRRGIRVPVYISVQWDHLTAMEHPEWLCVDINGAIIGAGEENGVQSPCEAGFYYTLCVNSPYRDLLKEQVKDVLQTLPEVDGLFFDIVLPQPCVCNHCKAGMLKTGLKPHLEADRMRYARQMINAFEADMTAFIRSYHKTCSIFYNSSHIGTGHRESKDAYTHFELESLPSGPWGYMDFPVTVRFARNLGLDCLAHTGKFHTAWGDFHSFKNLAALEFECFNMLSLNAKCLIGDQLEPNGALSKPVYDLIGSVYARVEEKEPWCRGARAVTDIGVLTPEEFYGAAAGSLPQSLLGVSRMLQESGHQFDVIDSQSDFGLYKLIVLPDDILTNAPVAQKITDYLKSGGAVIASFKSGMNEQGDFELHALAVQKCAEVTRDPQGNPVSGRVYYRNDYADYILPEGEIGEGLPATEHVMYIKGLEVEAQKGAQVLAYCVQPYFNRTYEHFCSHKQTPSSGKRGGCAVVKNGCAIYFAHPIFTQYNENAPRWCKQLFLNAVDMLLAQPVLRHDGPSTLLATVNSQERENRWVVHLLHYIPERRCREIDIIEDVIPLYDVTLSLRKEKKINRIELAPQGNRLEFEIRGDRVVFTVPKIDGHQMVSVVYE